MHVVDVSPHDTTAVHSEIYKAVGDLVDAGAGAGADLPAYAFGHGGGCVQSCHMANDVVDETAVYLTTGNPLPADIEKVVNWLLNEPFVTAFQSKPITRRYSTSCVAIVGGCFGGVTGTSQHDACSQHPRPSLVDVHRMLCVWLSTRNVHTVLWRPNITSTGFLQGSLRRVIG